MKIFKEVSTIIIRITEEPLMWESIQNGKRVNKIFESKDGNYISNFTVQGNVEKIEKELVFIRGILEKEKNN